MLSHQEIDNKDIMAIRYFEKEISETLSNLLITEYTDVTVLSIYSDLTKNLSAYKVLDKLGLSEDSWLNGVFNKKIRVDFNPGFSFIPKKFVSSGSEAMASDGEIEIECAERPDHVHYSMGLLKHHAQKRQDAIYVYKSSNSYSIFIFQGKNCVFANSFKCENEFEVLYYILNALDVSRMGQETTSLYLDYSLLGDKQMMDLLQPYFMTVGPLRLDHHEIDPRIPLLPEMLFPNYLLSLCV
jgi:hypothetical protein